MAIILDGTNGIIAPEVVSSGGPLAVSSEAPDNSLVVSPTGRVGIGTSSPVVSFEVRQGSSWFRASNQIDAVRVAFSSATSGYFIGGTSAGSLVFSDTSYVQRVLVDQAGRVSMPYKPMFMGYPTFDYSGGGMPTGVQSFTANYNNGNCFNPSNSRFTAPIAGWYRTTWGGLQLTSTVTSLRVNGSRAHNGNHWAGSGPAYITMTQTAIRYLNAGDYMDIEGWNGGGYYSGWYIWTVEQIA